MHTPILKGIPFSSFHHCLLSSLTMIWSRRSWPHLVGRKDSVNKGGITISFFRTLDQVVFYKLQEPKLNSNIEFLDNYAYMIPQFSLQISEWWGGHKDILKRKKKIYPIMILRRANRLDREIIWKIYWENNSNQFNQAWVPLLEKIID